MPSISPNEISKDQTSAAVSESNHVSSSIQDVKLALQTEGALMSRQDLLSTVDAIKILLADTYMHLNARAPFNKLPHELLTMIFLQVLPTHTAISFPVIEHDGYRPILHSLMVLSQVCRLWKDIASGTPALWTRIDAKDHPGDEFRSLVQRSDPLPLSLFLGNACEATMQAYSKLLRSSSSRLHRVDVIMNQSATPSVIAELLSFDGSTLRCLTVSSLAFEMHPSLDRDGRPHTIPILQGRTHSLNALAIVPFIGWIPTNHFPNLSHLYISSHISAQSLYPHDVLSFLRHTPRLEILHFHHLEDREAPLTSELRQPGPLPVELSRLRSLVFTVSAYHVVAEILHGLSLPPHTLIRLDGLFVSCDRPYPRPIPSNLGPLTHVSTMELAVQTEMLFLVVQGASSGLWLRVCHEEDTSWERWLSRLHLTMPLENLATLRIDVYTVDDEAGVLGTLPHMARLSALFARFKSNASGATALPLVRALCLALSSHGATSGSHGGPGPVVCPSLRALALAWPRNVSKAGDLPGVPDLVAMLSTRTRLGHPIRRLVVQASTAPAQTGSPGPIPGLRPRFSDRLSLLADHVEEYEECVDVETRVCAFEMADMWDVAGTEDYWTVDERLRPQYRPLWSHDYAYD